MDEIDAVIDEDGGIIVYKPPPPPHFCKLPSAEKFQELTLYRTGCCQKLFEVEVGEFGEHSWSRVGRFRYWVFQKYGIISHLDPGPKPPINWAVVFALTVFLIVLIGVIGAVIFE